MHGPIKEKEKLKYKKRRRQKSKIAKEEDSQ